jgi:hypothetical protein
MKPATSKLEIPLATLSFFLLGLAAQRWRAAVVIDVSPPPMIGVVAEARASADRDSLDAESDLVVRSDLFRLDRSTTPRLDTVVRLPAASGVPRPALSLRAIVGGPPWQAVLDGLPGQPAGTVVVSGGDYGGLRVGAITRDTVIVHDTDTTWRLTMKRGRP